jgi:hypothetical protein
MVRRFVHFGILFIEQYQDCKKTFHRNVTFFPVREIHHQRINNSLQSSLKVRNCRAGPKIFVYIRVANLADFSPKIANLGFLLKKVLCIF